MPSTFSDTILRLRADPHSLLTSACVVALDAFLVGYRQADPSIGPLLAQLCDQIAGPSGANACTRAYLAHADTRSALTWMLDALARAPAPASPPRASAAPAPSVAAIVRDAILAGRPAIVLGESTVLRLADFTAGYLIGLSSVDPEGAAQQQRELRAFEVWLGARYGGHAAPWFGLIRIFEGACERGLRRFIELWDEFEQRAPTEP